MNIYKFNFLLISLVVVLWFQPAVLNAQSRVYDVPYCETLKKIIQLHVDDNYSQLYKADTEHTHTFRFT